MTAEEYCISYGTTYTIYQRDQNYYLAVRGGVVACTEALNYMIISQYPSARCIANYPDHRIFCLGTVFDLIKDVTGYYENTGELQ